MTSVWRIAKGLAMMVAGVTYLGLSYIAVAWDHPPLIALVVGLIPAAGLALVSAFQLARGWRELALMVWAGAMAALGVWWHQLATHAALFYFIQHAGTMGLLAFTFGNTLWGTHEQALCSRVARLMVADDLDARYVRYTWQVTVAWALFFGITAIFSVLLFSWGTLAQWSLLANVLTPISLGAMFAVEYRIRVKVLPDRPHMSISETILAYRKYQRSGT
jgi:uncharacterized membrane protein